MSLSVERRAYHVKRVRHRARWVSWLLSPLVPVAITVWLLFNLIVCAGGNASARELLFCRHAGDLPGFSVLLVVGAAVFLLWGMHLYGQELLADEHNAEEWRVTRYRRHVSRAYGDLDEHQAVVFFAFEMTAWVLAAALLTLVFYWFNLAFPLGVLVMAAIVVTIVRLLRRLTRRFSTRPRPDPTDKLTPSPTS